MTMPRISVVTACFNNHDHLESTLCSILDQGYSNLQLIVVDGSTEDHTTAKLRHYRNAMDLWVRERCTSMAQAINVGLSRADGDIVAVLEAGNLYLPGTLETVARTMIRTHPGLWVSVSVWTNLIVAWAPAWRAVLRRLRRFLNMILGCCRWLQHLSPVNSLRPRVR